MPKVVFKYPDGSLKEIEAEKGLSVLEVAHKYDIPLEGACEGSLACSTCHVVVEDDTVFDSLSEASEEEEDMLDLAFGLTTTSRLGCQIIVDDSIDGIVLRIPEATRNVSVE